MTTSPTVMLPTDRDPHHAYRELLAHPRLHEFLRHEIADEELPPTDAEDIFGQVLQALWRRRDDADPPNSIARLILLAKTVLKGKLIDYFRHAAVRRAWIVDAPRPPGSDEEEAFDPSDQPNYVEEIAPAPTMTASTAVQVKEQFAFVMGKLDEGVLTGDDLEVIRAQTAGHTLEELAAQRGIPAGTLRSRLSRLKETLRDAWRKHLVLRGTLTVTLLILTLLLAVTLVVAAFRRKEPPPPPTPPPAETVLELGPRPPVREARPRSDPRLEQKSP